MIQNILKKGLVVYFIILFCSSSGSALIYSYINQKNINDNLNMHFKNPFFLFEHHPKINFIMSQGNDVIQTEDNGYIITGLRMNLDTNDPNPDFKINTLNIKYNENGRDMWSYCSEASENNWGYSVLQADDKGYVIGGTAFISGKSYAVLTKYDPGGIPIWNVFFDGLGYAQGTIVQKTNDSGLILTGSTAYINNSDFTYVFLIKTNENGVQEWTKTYKFNHSSVGLSIQETNDLGYILSGSLDSSDGVSSLIFLLKIDNNGNEQWNKTYKFLDTNIGYFVQQTNDYGYIIGGSMISHDNLLPHAIIIKTDETGEIQWYKSFTDKYAYSVQQTKDNGFIIGGTEIHSGGSYALLIKTDQNGNEEWIHTYEGVGIAQGKIARQVNDNGFILTGTTVKSLFSFKSYVLLLKTDNEGNLEWYKTVNKNKKIIKSNNNIIDYLVLNFIEKFPFFQKIFNNIIYQKYLDKTNN
jgi:hypothetical protein